MRKLAILCSGGDSQGMNACIKTITNVCNNNGIEPIGVLDGYQGLMYSKFVTLTNDMVRGIELSGGTILKTARSKEFMQVEGHIKAKKALENANIDALVVIGGNGSYRGARDLIAQGVKVICIPGTIDNDLFYTDKTLGFDTAVNNAVNAVDNIKQTMLANNRVFVVQVMGRECGHIALNVATTCDASSLIVKEVPVTLEQVVEDVRNSINMGVNSPLVVINESVELSVEEVQQAIEKNLNIETRGSVIGYIQRGGQPTVQDRLLATEWGVEAVKHFINKDYDVALGVVNNQITAMSLSTALNQMDEFNMQMYEHFKTLQSKIK